MKKILLIILISIILIPSLSRAQTDTYKLLEPIPCITGVGNCTEGGVQSEIDINSYILYVYKFSIAIAVFLAIVMIIWGGFLYITSETPFKIADGREKIQNAILGLVMVLVSYLILLTVDPRLVNIDSNIPKIKELTDTQIEALKDFNKQLISDLKNLSADNQQKITDNADKISKLQQESDGIIARIKNGEVDEEKSMAQLIKIDQEIKGLQVENKITISENQGINRMKEVIQFAYDPKEENATSKLEQYKETIASLYNQKIAEIKEISLNSNFIEIGTLEKQRDFYIKQAQEEVELGQKVTRHWEKITAQAYPGAGYAPVSYINNSEYLKEKLAQYNSDIVDEKKIAASGLSKELYTSLLKARIDTVSQTLSKPKP